MAKTIIDDDAPELTADIMARARPAREVLTPAQQAAFKRPPGRPRVAAPKPVVSLRMDQEVLDYFKSTGPGWQSRINAILAKEVGRR